MQTGSIKMSVWMFVMESAGKYWVPVFNYIENLIERMDIWDSVLAGMVSIAG